MISDKCKEQGGEYGQTDSTWLLPISAWQPNELPSNTQHSTGSTIALTIRSLDPLECGDWAHHDSIDMALLWSENQTTKEHLFKAYHRFKDVSVAC